MAYVAAQARQELLDTIAEAIEDLGVALGALGAAYDLLDEHTADRLEEELFRPVQTAYGRAQRTHAGFAERFGLPGRSFAPAAPGAAAHGARALLQEALDAAERADATLVALQDSMRPVEVGDAELRAGLADVREHVGHLRSRTRELLRTLGR